MGSAPWTEEEKKLLAKYYPTEGTAVSKRIPNHTPGACKTQANKMGLKPVREREWSEEEDDLVKARYAQEGKQMLSALPGRTYDALKHRAKLLGISYTGPVRPGAEWSVEADAFLRENAGKMSLQQIGEHVGKSRDSCFRRAKALGIDTGKPGPRSGTRQRNQEQQADPTQAQEPRAAELGTAHDVDHLPWQHSNYISKGKELFNDGEYIIYQRDQSDIRELVYFQNKREKTYCLNTFYMHPFKPTEFESKHLSWYAALAAFGEEIQPVLSESESEALKEKIRASILSGNILFHPFFFKESFVNKAAALRRLDRLKESLPSGIVATGFRMKSKAPDESGAYGYYLMQDGRLSDYINVSAVLDALDQAGYSISELAVNDIKYLCDYKIATLVKKLLHPTMETELILSASCDERTIISCLVRSFPLEYILLKLSKYEP